MNVEDTLTERGKTHGSFIANAITTQRMKDHVHSGDSWYNMSETQREAIEMILVKVGRIANGDPFEPDHWNDIVGYATLALKSFTKE